MKTKLFYALFAVVLLFATQIAQAATEAAVVAIAADGTENFYKLATVQRITVSAEGMTIERKGEEQSVKGVRCIRFGEHEFLPVVTELFQGEEVSVSVFPNPVAQTLHVQGAQVNAQLTVYDLQGRILLQIADNQVDVSALAQGTYLLKIDNQIVKFIKK